jgi:hypothetical protein
MARPNQYLVSGKAESVTPFPARAVIQFAPRLAKLDVKRSKLGGDVVPVATSDITG